MKLNKQPGIYQILNLVTGRSYIGQAKDISNRCATHRNKLRANKHINRHLQSSWNKYGESNFEFRKIINCRLDREELKAAEQYWNDYFQVHGGTYNIRKIVESNLGTKRLIGSMQGKKYSLESRAKMSAWQIGRKMSEEARRKMSLAKQIPVRSICPITGLITEYESLTSASRDGFHKSSICDALNGRAKTYRKLYWEYCDK